MEIKIPSIADQQKLIFEQATAEAIQILKDNLAAPKVAPQTEVNEADYPRTHLLRESEGWEAPHEDIVAAYFRHFQGHCPDYNTDAKLARLLGLSSDRRIREFKQGKRRVPYNVWRHFLIITGRAPQDVVKVLGYMA